MPDDMQLLSLEDVKNDQSKNALWDDIKSMLSEAVELTTKKKNLELLQRAFVKILPIMFELDEYEWKSAFLEKSHKSSHELFVRKLTLGFAFVKLVKVIFEFMPSAPNPRLIYDELKGAGAEFELSLIPIITAPIAIF